MKSCYMLVKVTLNLQSSYFLLLSSLDESHAAPSWDLFFKVQLVRLKIRLYKTAVPALTPAAIITAAHQTLDKVL